MPVRAVKRGDKWRVVEPSGRIAKTSTGKARDGGGHSSKAKATSQVRAINSNSSGKKKVNRSVRANI
jgi:hypothetical protein